MIKKLYDMMESRDFQNCLALAEKVMTSGDFQSSEIGHLQLIICRCRLGIQDPLRASQYGRMAVKIARMQGDWDLLGRALLNVGTALIGIRLYDEALHYFYSYFEHLLRYEKSRHLEGAIWKSIGIAHQRKLESDKAVEALQRAREWYMQHQIDHSAFTCSNDLIHTYLQMHDTRTGISLDMVAELLQYERRIAAKYQADTYYEATYQQDLAAYYMHLQEYDSAINHAQRACEIRQEDFWVVFHALMLLYRCAWEQGDTSGAFGYALGARIQAIRGKNTELESLATQAMTHVIREQNADRIRELDLFYQQNGIDLSQHISPSLLGRGH